MPPAELGRSANRFFKQLQANPLSMLRDAPPTIAPTLSIPAWKVPSAMRVGMPGREGNGFFLAIPDLLFGQPLLRALAYADALAGGPGRRSSTSAGVLRVGGSSGLSAPAIQHNPHWRLVRAVCGGGVNGRGLGWQSDVCACPGIGSAPPPLLNLLLWETAPVAARRISGFIAPRCSWSIVAAHGGNPRRSRLRGR